MVGFLNEYNKDPSKDEFLKAAHAEWDFIKDRLIMKEPGGEWYLKVDKEGSPDTSSPVVWPWKCPYHNGRMCLEVIKRIPDKDDR
jgi:mannobiose 2-epimerase